MLIPCVGTQDNYIEKSFPVLHYQECCPMNKAVRAEAVSDKEDKRTLVITVLQTERFLVFLNFAFKTVL